MQMWIFGNLGRTGLPPGTALLFESNPGQGFGRREWLGGFGSGQSVAVSDHLAGRVIDG